jgi:hypothetical protein
MCECSICLNPVRHTRKSKQLECGHLYHGTCIDEWVSAGGNTCPMCRIQLGSRPTFRVTINIENIRTRAVTTQEMTDTDVIEMLMARFNLEHESELSFSASNLEELNQIISDFGIDVDALVLDAE